MWWVCTIGLLPLAFALTQQMSPPGPYLMISGLKFFLDVGRITVKIDGLAAFFLASPFLIWASASGTNPIIFHCLPGRYQAFLKAFLCRKKDLFSIKMGKVNAIYFQQYIMFSLIFKYMDCCSEIVSDLNKIILQYLYYYWTILVSTVCTKITIHITKYFPTFVANTNCYNNMNCININEATLYEL